LKGLGILNIGMFYGNLAYFIAIWYILWSLGIFSRFGIGMSGKHCANPTIASYNASAVIFYNATSSLVRFENKNIYL
jgi:hypothetical protein